MERVPTVSKDGGEGRGVNKWGGLQPAGDFSPRRAGLKPGRGLKANAA